MTLFEWMSVIWAGVMTISHVAMFIRQNYSKDRAALTARMAEIESHLKVQDDGAGKVDTRLAVIEQTIKHQPTTRDMDVLRADFARVGEGVAMLRGSVEANTRVTDMMNSYLITREK